MFCWRALTIPPKKWKSIEAMVKYTMNGRTWTTVSTACVISVNGATVVFNGEKQVKIKREKMRWYSCVSSIQRGIRSNN